MKIEISTGKHNGKKQGFVKTILAELFILLFGVIFFAISATPIKTTGVVTSYYESGRNGSASDYHHNVKFEYEVFGISFLGETENVHRSYTEGEEVTVYCGLILVNGSVKNNSVIGTVVLLACTFGSIALIIFTVKSHIQNKKHPNDDVVIMNTPVQKENAHEATIEGPTKRCPYCDSLISLDAKHCSSCGADLSQD
ncbi:MAG: zinc ribbon domain-containing protein [Acholeplasmatales bacterium]|nr:zinc ribbon domain-containing protein [Acholeplasmatales bacterium]